MIITVLRASERIVNHHRPKETKHIHRKSHHSNNSEIKVDVGVKEAEGVKEVERDGGKDGKRRGSRRRGRFSMKW